MIPGGHTHTAELFVWGSESLQLFAECTRRGLYWGAKGKRKSRRAKIETKWTNQAANLHATTFSGTSSTALVHFLAREPGINLLAIFIVHQGLHTLSGRGVLLGSLCECQCKFMFIEARISRCHKRCTMASGKSNISCSIRCWKISITYELISWF